MMLWRNQVLSETEKKPGVLAAAEQHGDVQLLNHHGTGGPTGDSQFPTGLQAVPPKILTGL